MKFNCGPTQAEKKQKFIEEFNSRKKKFFEDPEVIRVQKWHKWFAWKPVRIQVNVNGEKSNKCIWLEWVERRIEISSRDAENAWVLSRHTICWLDFYYRKSE